MSSCFLCSSTATPPPVTTALGVAGSAGLPSPVHNVGQRVWGALLVAGGRCGVTVVIVGLKIARISTLGTPAAASFAHAYAN